MPPNFSSTANEIWAVADLLRGDFKQSQYGRIILPFALLRRLECVLAPTKAAVLAKLPVVAAMPAEAHEKLLLRESKQHFYNTGIATYIWILSNNKHAHRKGLVQLVHAVDCSEKMRKSLGSKRKQLSEAHITGITRLFADAKPHEPATGDLPLRSKLFPTTAFGYLRITVERPRQLRFDPRNPEKRAALAADKGWEKLDPDEQGIFLEALDTLKKSYLSRTAFLKDFKAVLKTTDYTLSPGVSKILLKHLGEHDDDAEICKDAKGNIEPNPDLRDSENVPLGEDIHAYFAREVTPHVPLAWIDETKRDDKDGGIGIVGYEIPFNRHFYTYNPPRQLDAIDTELAEVTGEIQELLREVAGA